MLAVEGTGLAKALKGRRILDGVDLAVEAGSCLAVVGVNGAGKSTLLRLVSGAMPADSGRLVVGGCDAALDPIGVRSQVGSFMGEDRSWYWRLSGRRNLEFFAALYPGVGDAKARVAELLRVVGLAGDSERRVGEYSTGMRARLGLARALLPQAPVIVLDEPTRSVDHDAANHLREVLLETMAANGTTVVIATHDQEEADQLANQLVVLSDGKLSPSSRPTRPLRPRQPTGGRPSDL